MGLTSVLAGRGQIPAAVPAGGPAWRRVRTSAWRRRWPAMALAGVLAVQAALYLPGVTGEYRFNRFNPHDPAFYLSLGHSLANGRGYTRSLDEHVYVPHTHFPPGFPMLLAAVLSARDSLVGPQLLVAAMAMGNTLLFWRLARPHVTAPAALLGTVLLVASPVYDQLAMAVMSEQPTTFFLLLSLLGLERWVRSDYNLNRWALLGATGLGFGLLVKGLLLPIVPAVAAVALLDGRSPRARRQRMARAGVLLGLALLPMAAWSARGALVHAPGYDGLSHAGSILRADVLDGPMLGPGELAGVAWTNVRWFVPKRSADTMAGAAFFLEEHFGLLPGPVLSVVLAALLAAGVAHGLRHFRRLGLVTLTLLGIMALLLVKHVGGAQRYWVSPQPLILLLLLAAARQGWRRFGRPGLRRRTLAAAGMLLVGATAAGMLGFDRLHRPAHGGAVWEDFAAICRLAQQRTEPQAVLLSHCPTAARYITRRTPWPSDAEARGELSPEPARPVYAIVPTRRVTAEWGEQLRPETLPLEQPALARTRYYALHRLTPPRP